MQEINYMPSRYDLNQFTEIHILDQDGMLLYRTGEKRFIAEWLDANQYVRSSNIGEMYDPEVGTICYFNAKKTNT